MICIRLCLIYWLFCRLILLNPTSFRLLWTASSLSYQLTYIDILISRGSLCLSPALSVFTIWLRLVSICYSLLSWSSWRFLPLFLLSNGESRLIMNRRPLVFTHLSIHVIWGLRSHFESCWWDVRGSTTTLRLCWCERLDRTFGEVSLLSLRDLHASIFHTVTAGLNLINWLAIFMATCLRLI
jgi:hypothetical protein